MTYFHIAFVGDTASCYVYKYEITRDKNLFLSIPIVYLHDFQSFINSEFIEVFAYELSGCGLESSCNLLFFIFVLLFCLALSSSFFVIFLFVCY